MNTPHNLNMFKIRGIIYKEGILFIQMFLLSQSVLNYDHFIHIHLIII